MTDNALIVEEEEVEEKKKSRGKPTRPDVVAATIRRAYTIELRKKGFTYREIEVKVREHFGNEALPKGYSYRRAYKDVKEVMAKHRSQIHEDVESMIELELTRLDAMLEGVWDRAEKGNTAAIDTVLKIMTRRTKLLGLDKPVKVAATNPEGDKIALPRDVIVVKEFLEKQGNGNNPLELDEGENE